MPRSVLVAALLALGCAQSSPQVRPLPATAIAVDAVTSAASAATASSRTAPYTRVARALERYRAAVESEDSAPAVVPRLDRRLQLRHELFEDIAEPALVSVVERRCSSEVETCWRRSRTMRDPLGFAVRLLSEFGGLPTLRMLTRFEGKGLRPPLHREPIVRRLMEESIGKMPCTPPSARELDRARKELDDFVVVDEVSGDLVPREPSPAERDDLAYFMVAVAEAAPPTRPPRPRAFSFHECSASRRASLLERVRLRQLALTDAEANGELEHVARARRQYLESLGYPGPLEPCWLRGGRSFPYRQQEVMSCLAGDLEALGQTREAEAIYRQIRWWRPRCASRYRRSQDALELAVIRTGERNGGCRGVAAERLRAPGTEAYGPQRLADAGFDLPRLYRGALLTRNRGGDTNELVQALNAARPDLATRAIARIQRRGPEAWEERVLALEGLADSAQRQALEPLQAVLPVLGEAAKLRALRAVGTLAWRHRAKASDCCRTCRYNVGGSGRSIRSLGRSCETQLDEAEARAVSRGIAPLLGDRSEDVRAATAEALGQVASAWSRRVLRPLARQPSNAAGGQCASGGCRTDHVLRETAREALGQIDRAYRPEKHEFTGEEAVEE
jgi:hypothetical protein